MKKRLETEAQRRRHGSTPKHMGANMREAPLEPGYFIFPLIRNVVEWSPNVR